MVDHEIWKILWHWAKRRHPYKNNFWIKDKYFMNKRGRKWVFAKDVKTKEGDMKLVWLVLASDTKIVRHIKIKAEANPFGPAQENYFEKRLGAKMTSGSVPGKVKWLRLWWRQDKECPVCHEKITEETGWNIHHVTPKSEGGGDNISNLVMMHPNCHRQHHNQSLRAAKTGIRKEVYERLEPCEGKLSSTVLRGGSSGNASSLPDAKAAL
jgi:RNA-directed DNA polymerase